MSGIIEIVEIGALFGPQGAARAACDERLWAALHRTGAVMVTGHPGAERIDERAREGLKIFDLPLRDKTRLATRLIVAGNRNAYRGFWPRQTGSLLQNDFFDVGPEELAPSPDLPGIDILTERTPWPDPEPVAGWRDTVRAHYDHLNQLAQALVVSIGRSAGFDEGRIRARFEGSHSTLRFLSYPQDAVFANAEPDGTSVAGRLHTDSSGLSLLWQAQPGLQAQGSDGKFREVPMLENGVAVLLGDLIARLTRGAVRATPHRVLVGKGARRSVGFFLEPALTAAVTPADDDGPTDVTDTYAWQMLNKLAMREMWRGVIHPPGLNA